MHSIDPRSKSPLLVSIRTFKDDIIYVASLYNVAVARSEAPVEKMFAAGLRVRKIIAKHSIEPSPLMSLDLSSAIPPQDLNRIKTITAITLADPRVRNYLTATILKNRDPAHMGWLSASEERRRYWTSRALTEMWRISRKTLSTFG
jgi:hypothetical protein